MILLNDAPPLNQSQSLKAMYALLPEKGMVHSSMMCGQHYDRAEEFDDTWACPAITWSAGGQETYFFEDRKKILVRSAGALALAAGARYAYAASDERPFRSNMIVFPKWITSEAARGVLGEDLEKSEPFETKLFVPDAQTAMLMNEIAGACASNWTDQEFYNEKVALLYQRLLQTQAGDIDRSREAVRRKTRMELRRRIDRAKQFILENYCDAALTLQTIAQNACLSPYHLIRVFKMQTGVTPVQYLTSIRMNAAKRLLQNTRIGVAEAAYEVGYTDRAAFSRMFTKFYGKAPSKIDRPAAPGAPKFLI